MTTDDHSTGLTDSPCDDLTLIEGIGEARRGWLTDHFAVSTFSDLAALSVDEIEAALRSEGTHSVARPEIEDWITQAEERAAASALDSAPTVEGTTPANDPNTLDDAGAADDPDAPNDPDPSNGSGWTPFASFVVEFQERTAEGGLAEYQTRANHHETDANEAWPGIEGRAMWGMWDWMLAQAGIAAQPEPAGLEHGEELDDGDIIEEVASTFESDGGEAWNGAAGEEGRRSAGGGEAPEGVVAGELMARTTLDAEADIAVEVTGVHVRQPADAWQGISLSPAGRAFSGFIRSAEPCRLEVSFDLIGASATDIARRGVPFLCQFHARNLTTGERLHLGNSTRGRLVEGRSSYSAALSSARLAKGMYRMDMVVIVQSVPPIPGHVRVPMIQVA